MVGRRCIVHWFALIFSYRFRNCTDKTTERTCASVSVFSSFSAFSFKGRDNGRKSMTLRRRVKKSHIQFCQQWQTVIHPSIYRCQHLNSRKALNTMTLLLYSLEWWRRRRRLSKIFAKLQKSEQNPNLASRGETLVVVGCKAVNWKPTAKYANVTLSWWTRSLLHLTAGVENCFICIWKTHEDWLCVIASLGFGDEGDDDNNAQVRV